MENEKWFWMMDYCAKHNLPPGQEWAWKKAEEQFNKHKKEHLTSE
jgi:hypothetical protein